MLSPSEAQRGEKNFWLLQIDMAGHSGWMKEFESDLEAMEARTELASSIIEALPNHGFNKIFWAGDGGLFAAEVDPNHKAQICVDAATVVFEKFKKWQKIQPKERRKLNLRVSLHRDEIYHHEEVGFWYSDNLSLFLKYERTIANTGAIALSNEVYRRLRPNTQKPFRPNKKTPEEGVPWTVYSDKPWPQTVSVSDQIPKKDEHKKFKVEAQHLIQQEKDNSYPYTIEVEQLSGVPSFKIDWPTLKRGSSILNEQIEGLSPEVKFDLIIGINWIGGLVASFLDGCQKDREKPIGMVKSSTKQKNKRRFSYSLPTGSRNTSSILLIDGTIKSGESLNAIVRSVKRKYGKNVSICTAVLIACGVDKIPSTCKMENLFEPTSNRLFKPKSGCTPDLLAFVKKGTISTTPSIA